MAKNPWMSAYLSAANTMMNTARGQTKAAATAQTTRAQKDMMSAWVDLWTPGAPAKKKSSAKKSTAKKRTTAKRKRS